MQYRVRNDLQVQSAWESRLPSIVSLRVDVQLINSNNSNNGLIRDTLNELHGLANVELVQLARRIIQTRKMQTLFPSLAKIHACFITREPRTRRNVRKRTVMLWAYRDFSNRVTILFDSQKAGDQRKLIDEEDC